MLGSPEQSLPQPVDRIGDFREGVALDLLGREVGGAAAPSIE